MQEYAAPKNIEPDIAAKRFEQGVNGTKDLLGIRSDRLFLKRRERQKGKKQYEKRSSRNKMYVVREGNCHFLVNFTDYLDTGLFLDHRPLREMINKKAKGKRFLNLFGYTGTATVHAAMGGAAQTTTVDLSRNYLEWARKNLALNGFGEFNHSFEQGDCLQWVQESNNKYDLIFIDPPTFSNTKKSGRLFDVQQDHADLITATMRLLEPDGTLYFSTNFRRFKINEELGEKFQVINITKNTIPHDFSRNSRIHSCWEIYHKE